MNNVIQLNVKMIRHVW